jgi:pimeloyl-ACP methyl ester carboxylesterase
MGYVTAKDGAQIFDKDSGGGSPVVFSHGWSLDADVWDPQLLLHEDLSVPLFGANRADSTVPQNLRRKSNDLQLNRQEQDSPEFRSRQQPSVG